MILFAAGVVVGAFIVLGLALCQTAKTPQPGHGSRDASSPAGGENSPQPDNR